MPTNKNALARIKFLDEMLSDRHHYYNLDDLTEKCNQKLEQIDVAPVTSRCVQKDINFIEYDGFGAEIERFTNNGKHCIRYADPSFSIFSKKLSDDEKNLLQEALSTLGQFDGLENFSWLDNFKKSLEIEERHKIICFSHNPYLKNSNLLGELFNYISNRNVIELTYRLFNTEKSIKTVLHPYLLKQYNDRWFLIGADNCDQKILTMALDRIESIAPINNTAYINPPDDLLDRFDDIIGVTLYDDKPLNHIVFWVSDISKNYVLTKPLHGSQKMLPIDKAQPLREKFPMLSGGEFFSIECISNYELIRDLSSFGKELLVISPMEIQNEVTERIRGMLERYKRL